MNLFPDLEPLQDYPIAQLGGPPNWNLSTEPNKISDIKW